MESQYKFPLQRTRSRIRPASKRNVKKAAKALGFQLEGKEIETYLQIMNSNLNALKIVDQLPDFQPRSAYPRTAGYKPDSSENPLNGWAVKVEIKGRSEGKLFGKTCAVKDNACIAGVPMMNGSSILEGYVPDVDATVITRLLDAGAVILGKAHCESLSFSGASNTNSTGHIHNPHKHGYSAGGSSSGSAALVAAGEVDIAIGGDQGGSIRIPSSNCGIVGMKPTFGLVPATGVYSIMHAFDHVGPMTRTVRENALALEALAGPDGFDTRQGPLNHFTAEMSGCVPLPAPKDNDYLTGIDDSISGMKFAIVKESLTECDQCVVDGVTNAGKVLQQLGAQVDHISIPLHLVGEAVWLGIGFSKAIIETNFCDGVGTGGNGLHPTSLMEYMQNNWKIKSNECSETGKIAAMTAYHIENTYGGHLYGKSQNLALRLTQEYDKALSKYDVILLPTLPKVAQKLNDVDDPPEVVIDVGLNMLKNTAVFDITGHPALTVPCGFDDKDHLPIGLMIVGRKLDEKTLYKVGNNFEKNFEWKHYVTPTKSRL